MRLILFAHINYATSADAVTFVPRAKTIGNIITSNNRAIV